jgi:methyl-accepting chemotaxis protein
MKNTSSKEKKGFKIIYQILLSMFLIASIPITGFWYISIYKGKQNLTESIQSKLIYTTNTFARAVDDWTDMNLLLLKQNASIPAMYGMNAESQNPVLKSISDTYKWIYLAFTIAPNGKNIGRSDGKPPKFYGDRKYFKDIMNGRFIGQQVLIGKTSGKPALVLSKPIKDKYDETQGVLAIAMTLNDLSKIVTKTKIGKTGYAILLDNNNRLIAHGQGKILSKLQDYTNYPILQTNDFIYDIDGKKVVAYTAKTKQNWTLIVQQDYDEAYLTANKIQKNALFLLIITFVLVLIIGYLLASHLSKPILNLTNIANEISRGKLDTEIKEVSRGDEIGSLARALKRMGVSLKLAFEKLKNRQ